jgi:ligand-binding sensor domain-containing protein/signal transduction histidine kinase
MDRMMGSRMNGRAVLIVALLLSKVCFAGPPAALDSYTRHVWQAPDGLPEQTVQAFAQTRDSFLWIGTTGGLLRFDGAHFTLFDRENTPALHENNIFCLMVAHDGALWIGTEGGGLARFTDGHFRSWTTREGLSNDFVRTIAEAPDGAIWAGTDNGLLRLKGDRFQRVDDTAAIPSIAVHSIVFDSTGDLWAGGSRLIRVHNGSVREYLLPGEASQSRVKSILQTSDGSIWIGTVSGLNHMVGHMVGGDERFMSVPGISATVRVLRQTPDGTLWIGTIGQGIYTSRGGSLSHMTAPAILPSNTVLNLFEDNEQNLWIGTQAGMLRLTRTPMRVVSLPQANDSDFGTVYMDRDGSLWIGSTRLFRMRGTEVSPAKLPGLANVHVRNVFRDRFGALWVGTDGDGVFRIASDGTSHFTTREGLSNNFVRAFAEDRDGSMWIANDEGINHIFGSGQNRRVVSYETRNGLAYFSTRALLEDRQGDLWIGTDNGLSHLHRGAFIIDAATAALAHAKIWAIHEDVDGGLWFGTRNSGLYRFRDGRIAHYTTDDGLASNAVYQIVEDARGHFWMSGPGGVSLMNRSELDSQAGVLPRHLAVAYYSVAAISGDIQIYGGTQSSGCMTAGGEVWFPSNRGPIQIVPWQRSMPPPPVRIEAILANGSQLPIKGPIHLAAGVGRVEFTYSPIRLRSQESIRFRYRLDGFEHEWNAATTSRAAEYTNLPSGRYTFRVQAYEIENPGTSSEAIVEIVQEPHFYRTWWFIASTILALGLVIYAIYQYRLQQVRARFEAVLEERSRVAREMHDTVIQGCTSVSALLEAVSMQQADESPRDGLMDFARSQLRSTIDEARDAIWNLRQPNDSLLGLGEKLESVAKQIGSEFNTAITCSVAGHPFSVTQPVSHDLLMVAREAILNAVLHGAAAHIRVHLAYAQHDLALRVVDDGRGFEPSQPDLQNGHHFGLKGMDERVKRCGGVFSIRARPGHGVCVEAQVPYSSLKP